MTDDTSIRGSSGPILLCAGTDPAAAAHLAEVAASVLASRPAVVLATWEPPPLTALRSMADSLYDTQAELRDIARRAAMDTARAAADVLHAHGIHVTRQVCPEEQSPWEEILDAADRFDASVVVAGTSEDAAARHGTLGGQARALAHRAHRPLLLVPADGAPAGGAQPAIFAYDGSPAAGHAVTVAAQILAPRPALVASVWQTASYVVGVAMLAVPDEVVRKGAEGLDDAARLRAFGEAGDAAQQLVATGWSSEGVAVETARNVPTAILETADEHDAAVIVTGTRGRSRIAAALLGSSAEAIARHAGRPVLLVPPAVE
jgi:nucleotide-binding universal stress UspA family protein